MAATSRIPELDGLRAIAVGLVFLNHFAPVRSMPWLAPLHRLGWVGVDAFFVLSGFLVTGILIRARLAPVNYYRNFYARRSLRIFPLYYALLTLILITLAIPHQGQHLHELLTTWGNPAWLYIYLGNVVTSVRNTSPPGYFVPLWSLHVEEQFYLIFPLIVLHASNRQLRRLCIAAITIAPLLRLLAWLWLPTYHLLPYMLFPCRMDALAVGALLAIHPPRLRDTELMAGTAGLMVMAVGSSWALDGGAFDAPFTRTIGYSLFDAAFAGVILLILRWRRHPGTAWLTSPPLQFLGMVSYGFYLFQFPAEGLVFRLAKATGVTLVEGTIIPCALVAATCLALSTISWYFWETPWLSLKSRFIATEYRVGPASDAPNGAVISVRDRPRASPRSPSGARPSSPAQRLPGQRLLALPIDACPTSEALD